MNEKIAYRQREHSVAEKLENFIMPFAFLPFVGNVREASRQQGQVFESMAQLVLKPLEIGVLFQLALASGLRPFARPDLLCLQ